MLKRLEKNKTIALTITTLIALEIFFYSTIQGGINIGGSKLTLATLYHFSIFFLFSFFLLIVIKGKNKINKKYFLMVLIISILYGIFDEIHQMFTPGRNSTITDVLIDSLGSLFAIGVYWFIEKKTNSFN